MRQHHSRALCAFLAAILLGLLHAQPARAYIGGPPASLGHMCWWSTHVCIVQVDKVDRQKGLLSFRKLRDVKGKWPTDIIRQNVGTNDPGRQYILQWAEPGKTTVMFALESYKWSHTYIDQLWYASVTNDWQVFSVSHTEPILLRTYSGRAERLISAATGILAGREVVVPCLVGDNPADLASKRAKVQRLRCSLKLLDYNAKRDFVNWGSDDYRSVGDMPGFASYWPLGRVDAEAQALATADSDGNGLPDFCLVGTGQVVHYESGGDYFSEMRLPGLTAGGRGASWADYNGDGRADLLLCTPGGLKLFTNLGNGQFRDDSALLPRVELLTPSAAVWIDQDADGWPDILVANGYHGLRLYRNKGLVKSPPTPVKTPPGQPPVVLPWFEDRSDQAGLGSHGFGSDVKGQLLAVADVDGDGYPDFVYSAGGGMLFHNTPRGFEVVKDAGFALDAGVTSITFGDADNDGQLDLFATHRGGCQLYRSEGRCRFAELTAKAGDLGRFQGWATSAAWGDFDNDGHLDLVVGCLRGPNRCFRNQGDGTFADATAKLGLDQRIFNTQAVSLADLNNDGKLDMIFLNEGQESCVLLGNPEIDNPRTPVTVQVGGAGNSCDCRLTVQDANGKQLALREIAGGCKGGQQSTQVRFALAPGTYQVVVRSSADVLRTREITVGEAPLRVRMDETSPLLAVAKE